MGSLATRPRSDLGRSDQGAHAPSWRTIWVLAQDDWSTGRRSGGAVPPHPAPRIHRCQLATVHWRPPGRAHDGGVAHPRSAVGQQATVVSDCGAHASGLIIIPVADPRGAVRLTAASHRPRPALRRSRARAGCGLRHYRVICPRTGTPPREPSVTAGRGRWPRASCAGAGCARRRCAPPRRPGRPRPGRATGRG